MVTFLTFATVAMRLMGLLPVALATVARAMQPSSSSKPWLQNQPQRRHMPQSLGAVTAAMALTFNDAAAAFAQDVAEAGEQAAIAAMAAAPGVVQTFEPRGITTEDTVVFVIGCVPFLWATIEFWRRIFVGDPFGTGQDSVIINDTSGNRPKGVRRVLGQDAITAAYILFGLAGASAVLVAIAGVDVMSR